MSEEKINHHYVPASYLRGFTIEGENSLVWGYSKEFGKCTGKRSVDRICSEDYYYEQPKPDGSKTQCMEDAFNEVEKASIEAIKELHHQNDLPASDKGALALYVALMLTRGPSFRDGCHLAHKHLVDITAQKLYENGEFPEMPKELKKHMKNNDITSVIKAEILPHVSLQYMIKGAVQIGESLCNKKWVLFFSENDSYITSDTPVLFVPSPDSRVEIGPANSQSGIICPLSKNMTLVARPYYSSDKRPFEFKEAEKNFVELVNKLECFSSQRFVYSPMQSKQLLEHVKSAKGYSQKSRAFRLGNSVIQKWGVDKD